MADSVQMFKEVRDTLDEVRLGKEVADGKKYPRPSHLVNREIVKIVTQHLKAQGEFFRAPSPMFFDRVLRRVINVVPGDGELRWMLRQFGFMPSERHSTLVEQALVGRAAVAPERALHRISCMKDSEVYINAGLGRMIKVTTEGIEEVDLGTGDVILLDPLIQEWPAFSDIQVLLDEMRPLIGTSCTELRPDLPLTQHLTTRWSKSSKITPEQAHQAYITRLLFSFSAASRVPLWPALLFSGEQNSGKSTGLELAQLSVYGRIPEGVQFPSTVEDLQLAAATSSLLAYDNMDGANLDAPRNASMADTLCLIATGGRLNAAASSPPQPSIPIRCGLIY